VKHEAKLIDLGTRAYADVWAMQLALVKQRQQGEIPDTLLFVEHPHVITAGRSAKRDNLLDLGDTPLYEIERGGDVTYHGPGQLVGYPIIHLGEGRRDVRKYVTNVEEVLIRTCGDFGISAQRIKGLTGVWTYALRNKPEAKIGAIGVHISRAVTTHGFALNVSIDLDYFSMIVPCGIADRGVTSLARLGCPASVADVQARIVEQFSDVFERQLVSRSIITT
jgi:lipoyl(octanoyl) transferase